LRKWAPDDDFALRLSVFYIATFLIIGCYMPFLPVWLRWRGLDETQIGLIYSMPVFVRAIFTPAMTFLADRSGRPVTMLKAVAWASLFSALMLPLTGGFATIFAVILLFTLFWMSVIPLTDAVALAGARAGRGDYGRMRVWGSLSYVGMTVVGGTALQLWGPQAALWLFIGAAATVALTVYGLPRGGGYDRAFEDALGLPLQRLRLADLMQLVRAPMLWLFFAATSTIQSAHALYYIFGTLHWTSIGISPAVIGLLWGVGVIAEIVLFAYASWVGRWLGPAQLICLAGTAAVLRWLFTAYDPSLPVLFVLQSLHGLTFGAAHLGAMQFMGRALPQRLAASAQGLYASITAGVVMGLSSLSAGPLYRAYEGRAYLAMALLACVGLTASLVLMRQWRGGLIFSPREQPAAAE
jgi:MFS transporter, PPP family, 3-phenylpropionic acid transporter